MKPTNNLHVQVYTRQISVFMVVYMHHHNVGFQLYLATTPVDSRKGFKPMKAKTITKSTSVLLSHMLPHLDKPVEKPAGTTSDPCPKAHRAVVPRTVSHHIDTLSLSEPVRRALGTSVNRSASYIIQGMRGALANWNLRSVTQLLFIDGPKTSIALTQTANTLARTICPQYSFPPLSSLSAIEHRSRDAFSVAHDGLVNLKVRKLYIPFYGFVEYQY